MKKLYLCFLLLFSFGAFYAHGQSPTAWWPLDGSASDIQNNNHGAVSGASFTSGKFGQAASFSGGDHISLPLSIMNSGQGSVSLWIRTTQSGDGAIFYGAAETGGNLFGSHEELHLNVNSNGRLDFYIEGSAGGSDVNLESSQSVNDGNWHHVAATWQQNGSVSLYIDNNLAGSVSHSAPSFSFSAVFRLGAAGQSGSFRSFDGDIDQVRVYNNYVLSQSEISALFNEDGSSNPDPDPPGECAWVSYQAEDGSMSAGSVDSNHSGFNGSGFVNTDNNSGEWFEINVSVPSGGAHDMSLRYANGTSSDRPVSVSVNGSPAISNLSLPGTGAWNNWSTVDFNVSLNSGNNVVRFTALTSGGAPNADQLEVCQGESSSTQYTLTTSVNGQGSVNPSGGQYADGSTVTLTANPASGWQFDGWSGALSGSTNPAQLTMNGNKSVTANFSQIPPNQYSLNVTINGSGTVSRNPNQSSYNDGQQVTLTANPSSGWEFSGWSGDASGTNSSTTITMNSNKSVTANFIEAGGGGGDVDFSLVGYATLAGGTTGGQGGNSVTVSTGTALQDAISNKGSQPLTIYVNGTITPSNSSGLSKINVKDVSDISILGVGTSGELNGIGIKIWRASNIIIRNLRIHHVDIGDKDCISIEGPSDHIWVDHCELYNVFQGAGKDHYDGLLDVKGEADYITFSWNYLHDSWKTSLSGSSDGDDYGRRVTYHHNWYENNNSRLPLFRFGQGHIFNNYYNGIASTGINSRMGACIRVENNYFENALNPIVSAYSDDLGATDESGNIFGNNVTWDFSGDANEPLDCNWNAAYSYSHVLHSASETPSIVTQYAGVGVIDVGARIATNERGLTGVELLQNYPNPFSGHTSIGFTVKETQRIRINLYNSLGKLVDVIANREFDQGKHEVDYQNDKLKPGIYIYSLETSKGILTRRMMVR